MKAETFLRFCKVPYENNYVMASESPTKKCPFITYNDDIVPDSTQIINYLTTKGITPDLDADLTSQEKALTVAVRALVEDSLYFSTCYNRWVSKKPSAGYKNAILAGVPTIIRGPLWKYLQHDVGKTLYRQGISRNTEDEILVFMKRDISAIAELLGEKKWIHGNKGPTSLDAVIFGSLGSSLYLNIEYLFY